jgi:hypothetical protein
MFVAIWRFTTQDPAAFEQTYGPQGLWAKLFAQSEDYGGTDLLRDGEVYLTLDWWRSREAYDRFKSAHAAEYAALDAQCEALTVSEEKIGEFLAALAGSSE